MTRYFTFGQTHQHVLKDVILNRDTVVRISCEDPRTWMFRTFGPKWAMEYEELPDMRLYPGGLYELKIVRVANPGYEEAPYELTFIRGKQLWEGAPGMLLYRFKEPMPADVSKDKMLMTEWIKRHAIAPYKEIAQIVKMEVLTV